MSRNTVTLRKLSPAEQRAAELARQNKPLRSIIIQTGLSKEQIAVAVERQDAWDELRAQGARTTARQAGWNKTPAPGEPDTRSLWALAEQAENAAPGAVPDAVPIDVPVIDRATGLAVELADESEPEPEPEPVFEPGSEAWDAIATSRAARVWAIADGWIVPPSPRLPGAIVLAYHAAHRGAS